jgi:selenocysteine-specific elongation factor
MARTVLLEVDRLDPGDQGWAQLRLEAPLVARAGDRFVVRSYSPVTTIGGGRVVEPDPRKRTRLTESGRAFLAALLEDAPDSRVLALVRDAGLAGVRVDRLPLDAGCAPADVDAALSAGSAELVAGAAFPAEAAGRVTSALLDAARAYHARRPLRPGMDVEELRRAAPPGAAPALVEFALEAAVGRGDLVGVGGRVAARGHEPRLTDAQETLRERMLAAIAAAGTTPLRLEELRAELGAEAGDDLDDLVRLALDAGDLVRLEPDLYMVAAVLDRLVTDVRTALAGRSGLGPADFKDVVPVTRKSLIPILEHLDRLGVTARSADGRAVTAGPPGA